MNWLRGGPHRWDHVNGLRFELRAGPVQLLMGNSPVVPVTIRTVLPWSLSQRASHHCWMDRTGKVGAEAAQYLRQTLSLGLKLSLSLVLVKAVGPLLLLGGWDGAGAPGALLDRGAPMRGVARVKRALSLRRGGAGTLVWERRGGALVMRLEEGLVCDAVARRGSWRGVGGRGVDALQARAQVQRRQGDAVGASIRRWDTRRGQGRAGLGRPARGGVAAGRADAVPVGQRFGAGARLQIPRVKRITWGSDLNPGAGRSHVACCWCQHLAVKHSICCVCGEIWSQGILPRCWLAWGGDVSRVMIDHQQRRLAVVGKKGTWIICYQRKKSCKTRQIWAQLQLLLFCLSIFFSVNSPEISENTFLSCFCISPM